MSEHREWDFKNFLGPLDRLKDEHNAAVRAYRDAMAECDRLGKANDEACDRIAELERALSAATQERSRVRKEAIDTIKALESRPVLTWEECLDEWENMNGRFDRIHHYLDWLKSRLPAPTDSIRVPFSDAQIEAMARAAHDCRNFRDEQFPQPNWETLHDDLKAKWRSAIRAALAAGGLEPCAVPEYTPEDVALNSRVPALEKQVDELTAWLNQTRAKLQATAAKSARRRVALKALNRTVAGQSDLIQRFLRAGKEPVRPEPAAHGCPVSSPAVSKATDRFWAKRKELGHQTPPAPVWTDEQIEALARVLYDAYWEGDDDMKGEYSAMFTASKRRVLREARAAFAHIGAQKRPEGMPSVEELAEVLHKAEPHMPPATYRERNEAMAEAILAALTPWLREPTGWTLERPEHGWLTKGFCVMDPATGEQHDVEGLVDHIASRIRPTFDSDIQAELDHVKTNLAECEHRIDVARAAMEGE